MKEANLMNKRTDKKFVAPENTRIIRGPRGEAAVFEDTEGTERYVSSWDLDPNSKVDTRIPTISAIGAVCSRENRGIQFAEPSEADVFKIGSVATKQAAELQAKSA